MLKKIKENKHILVFVFLQTLLLMYVINRAATFPQYLLLPFFCIIFVLKDITKLGSKWIGLIMVAYLVFVFFGFRSGSWDGLALYLKNTLLLTEDFYITSLNSPAIPYLGELFLALVFRVSSVNVMNLMFGLSTVLAIYLVYEIYKELRVDKDTAFYSLIVLVGSYTFLSFTFYEFKIDMFWLVVSCVSFLLTINLLRKPSLKVSGVLGVFLAAAILIKLIFIVPAIVLLTLLFCFSLVRKDSGERALGILGMLLSGATASILVLSWLYYFGGSIPLPQYQDLQIFGARNAISRPILTTDFSKYEECRAGLIEMDYERYIKYDNLKDLFFQPFYYLTLSDSFTMKHPINSNPGLFMFMSFFLFPFLPLFKRNLFLSKEWLFVYLFTVLNLVFFYLYIGRIYWYVFYLFPFLALAFPLLIKKFLGGNYLKIAQAELAGYALFTCMLMFLMAASINQFVLASSKKELMEQIGYQNLWDVHGLANYLNQLDPNVKILNAAEFNEYVLIPFVDHSDERVVQGNYYFYASGKSLDEMLVELKSVGIEYIMVKKSVLLNSWYRECPLKNNEILNQFLEKHTIPVYPEKDPVLFKIN